MKSSTANKVQGAGRQVKGKIKEVTGRVTNNRTLEGKGTAEKLSGKAERKAGDVKKVFGR